MIQAEAFRAALVGLVSNRVYPTMFPQSPLPTWPAIRYTPVGGETFPDVCGTADGTTDDVTVQVDSCALTFAAARDLAQGVRNALLSFDPPVTADGPASFDYDAELKIHRAVQFFTLHPSG